MIDDVQLLRKFVEQQSQEAFAELVRQRIGFVYASALRLLAGDAHLAQDVTQGVFLALARTAPSLVDRSVLVSWLYMSTRFLAGKAVRTQRRWQAREREANALWQQGDDEASEPDWAQLRFVLDGAMQELSENDREVVLLRYFDGRAHAEIGRVFGLDENAARMRVTRTLEKLRLRLAKRGITSTAAALGVALAHQPAVAVPTGLAATVAGTSLAGAALASGGSVAQILLILSFMNTTKLAVGAFGALAALAMGIYLGRSYENKVRAFDSTLNTESKMAFLLEENRRLTEQSAHVRSLESSTPKETRDADSERARATVSADNGQWRLLADLQKKKLVDSRITFVKPNGNLNEAFASLFALTPGEQDDLQRSLQQTSEKVADLERQNATVTRDHEGNVKIAIKAFASAGGALYDDLIKSFAETLGPERNAAFLTLGADQVEKAFARFGAEDRTLGVSYDPTAHNQIGAYSLLEEIKVSSQESSTSNGEYRTLHDVVERIGTAANLLPPDFGIRK